jgi:hypothetical protein
MKHMLMAEWNIVHYMNVSAMLNIHLRIAVHCVCAIQRLEHLPSTRDYNCKEALNKLRGRNNKVSVDYIHTMNMIYQRDVDRLNYTKKQITELLVKISKCVEAIKNLSLILSMLEQPTNTVRDLEEWVNTYHINCR